MEEKLPGALLNKQKLTWPLIHVTLISTFGSSFQFGYNLWVMNHPAILIKFFYNETYYKRTSLNIDSGLLTFMWDLMVSLFPFGGIVGCLLSAPMADTYGRKITIVCTSILSVVSAFLMSFSKFAHAYEFIFIARMAIGVGIGVSSNVVPMYLAEMAPSNLRGAIVMVSYLFLTIGALMAQLFGLDQILGNNTGWPVLLGITGIPAFLQILLLPSFPESPRYLLIQEKNEMAARNALQQLRGQDDVEDELEELRQEDLAETEEKCMNIFQLLCFPALRWQYLSVCVLVLGHELSGIHVMQFYLESIYLSTGIEEFHSQYFGLLVALILVLLSLGTIFVVDSWGRRVLLLAGFGICSFSCVFFTMCLDLQGNIPQMSYLSTTFAIFFFFGNAIGPAPIPSLVIGELFLQSSRSTAYEIGGILKWLCQFISVMVFFQVKGELWTYTFLTFLPFSAATIYYIFRIIPETKNKTFLEIKATLAK